MLWIRQARCVGEVGVCHAEALGLGAPPKSLDEEIAELRNADKVDAELEALKASLAKRSNGGEASKGDK